MESNKVTPTITLINEAVEEHREGKPEKLVNLFLDGYSLRAYESSKERMLELLRVSNTGKGRPKKTIETSHEHNKIMSNIAYLHGADLPLYNETNPDVITACSVVAKIYGKNPKSLYASYAKEREKPELKSKFEYGLQHNLFIREFYDIG